MRAQSIRPREADFAIDASKIVARPPGEATPGMNKLTALFSVSILGSKGQLPNVIYLASIWVIPLVNSHYFHEAAHGFVARFLGDERHGGWDG